jgi:hypothetical protein
MCLTGLSLMYLCDNSLKNTYNKLKEKGSQTGEGVDPDGTYENLLRALFLLVIIA